MRLDDNSGGVSLIQGPDTKTPVFVRCVGDKGWIVDLEGAGEGYEGFGDTDGDDMALRDDEVRLEKGQVWVVRWEGVREGVNRGILEVL